MSVPLVFALLLAGPSPWQPLFEATGVSPAEASVDREAMALYGAGAHRLPLFDYLLAEPSRLAELGRIQGAGFTAESDRPSVALARAAWLGGRGVRRGLGGTVMDAYRRQVPEASPFETALARLRAAAGASPGTLYQDPSTAGLPAAVQRDLALLLTVITQVASWRSIAFEEAPAAGLGAHLSDLMRFATSGEEPVGTEAMAHQRRLDRLINSLDLAALNAAAADLALALDDIRGRLTGQAVDTSLRYATPWGEVVIGGRGVDQCDGPPPLLVVDFGGDDVYHAGAAAATADWPVSVILDLAGNDTYQAEGTAPAWGAAVGGIALLLDQSGNDRYLGRDVTQGCGIGGVGLLWDGGGDDTYRGRVHAQGAAAFGVGLLLDTAGNDSYLAVHRSQGHGYTLGVGVLADAAGSDSYLADDETLLFRSEQTPEHNASLSQGFGFGRRADFTHGRSLAGGIGWLVDGGGDDTYQAGVFAQGAGYWYGVGMLSDLGGDDRYRAVWYAQAAAAHFAVGGLYDAVGNDSYQVTMNVGLGAGHDFSLASFTDLAGNDTYQGGSLSHGAGNANGVGYFHDLAGDDDYRAEAATSLGVARMPGRAEELALSPRREVRTLGFFLDSGGRDRYARAGAADGTMWRDRQENSGARGAALDR